MAFGIDDPYGLGQRLRDFQRRAGAAIDTTIEAVPDVAKEIASPAAAALEALGGADEFGRGVGYGFQHPLAAPEMGLRALQSGIVDPLSRGYRGEAPAGIAAGPTAPLAPPPPRFDPSNLTRELTGVTPTPSPMRPPADTPGTSSTAMMGAQRSPSIRALRLANGRVLFTNRPDSDANTMDTLGRPQLEAGGKEIPIAEAAAEGRGMDWVNTLANPVAGRMSSLVRAAADQEGARQATGYDESKSVAGASFPEGTPEQQTQLATDRMNQEADLAGAKTRASIGGMTPQAQANLGNRDIGTSMFMLQQYQPIINAVKSKNAALIASVIDPKSPHFIPDQAKQAAALEQIRAQNVAEIQSIMDKALSVGAGQRMPLGY